MFVICLHGHLICRTVNKTGYEEVSNSSLDCISQNVTATSAIVLPKYHLQSNHKNNPWQRLHSHGNRNLWVLVHKSKHYIVSTPLIFKIVSKKEQPHDSMWEKSYKAPKHHNLLMWCEHHFYIYFCVPFWRSTVCWWYRFCLVLISVCSGLLLQHPLASSNSGNVCDGNILFGCPWTQTTVIKSLSWRTNDTFYTHRISFQCLIIDNGTVWCPFIQILSLMPLESM